MKGLRTGEVLPNLVTCQAKVVIERGLQQPLFRNGGERKSRLRTRAIRFHGEERSSARNRRRPFEDGLCPFVWFYPSNALRREARAPTNSLRLADIQRLNAHLERLSNIDGLTGLFNRRYLDVAQQRSWKVAADRERWIGFFLIDSLFQSGNDTGSHQFGEFCLERVAEILQNSVRIDIDTVARYGANSLLLFFPTLTSLR